MLPISYIGNTLIPNNNQDSKRALLEIIDDKLQQLGMDLVSRSTDSLQYRRNILGTKSQSRHPLSVVSRVEITFGGSTKLRWRISFIGFLIMAFIFFVVGLVVIDVVGNASYEQIIFLAVIFVLALSVNIALSVIWFKRLMSQCVERTYKTE